MVAYTYIHLKRKEIIQTKPQKKKKCFSIGFRGVETKKCNNVVRVILKNNSELQSLRSRNKTNPEAEHKTAPHCV